MNVGDLLPLAGKGPDQVVEQLVGAVGHDEPLGIEAVQFGGRRPAGPAGRVGVLAQPLAKLGADRLDHPGRRGIGVLVGIELDPGVLVLGLESGDVTGHSGDVLA